MLGLTVPDAIAFGSLCAALLAACAGMARGERVRKESEPPPEPRAGSSLGQREAFDDLASAVTDLAAAIRAATLAETARDQYGDMIHAIMRRLDDRTQNFMR